MPNFWYSFVNSEFINLKFITMIYEPKGRILKRIRLPCLERSIFFAAKTSQPNLPEYLMQALIGLIQIGSAEKHSGKTTFSTMLIKNILKKHPEIILYGIKATILEGKEKSGGYSIFEEKNADKDKDTSKLLKAGAAGVFWLRTDEKNVLNGLTEIKTMLKPAGFIVCESNSLRKYIKPDIFIMIKRKYPVEFKKSALEVIQFADIILESEAAENSLVYTPDIIDKIDISGSKWILKEDK
jgi:hypothetical protein